jgi:hypothetical protein
MKCSDIPEAEIIEACRRFHAGETTQTPDEALSDKYPVKIIMAKMQKMADKGRIEYGVSLRTAWPADRSHEKGRAQ